MLRTRLWTALVALPTVLTIVVLAPPILFTVFIGVLGAWGLYEIGTVAGVRRPSQIAAVAVVGGVPLVAILCGAETSWILPAAVIAAMLGVVVRVAVKGPDGGQGRTAHAILGAIYVGVLFPFFARLRALDDGVRLIILMLLLVIATDTAAYFAGTYLGKLKLCPKVSPHKTVEGAIAGLAACLVSGWILRAMLVPGWSRGDIALASLAIGVLAQLGDLAGSAYKRAAGVKDFGRLFPGHGGLLDRTCSLVFATAFTYYYA
ncbi:MAG: phosphatidate cytidylyltransferase [Candidatus Binataceae bacterium]